MTITFRTALQADDVAAIRALAAATGVFSAVELGWTEDLAREVLAKGAAKAGLWFELAHRDAALAGFTVIGPIEGTDRRFDLYWIAVAPAAQGTGLGRTLLTRAAERARSLGASHLFIETSTRGDYAAARALYAACGFPLIATLPDYYADGDGKAVFGRRL